MKNPIALAALVLIAIAAGCGTDTDSATHGGPSLAGPVNGNSDTTIATTTTTPHILHQWGQNSTPFTVAWGPQWPEAGFYVGQNGMTPPDTVFYTVEISVAEALPTPPGWDGPAAFYGPYVPFGSTSADTIWSFLQPEAVFSVGQRWAGGVGASGSVLSSWTGWIWIRTKLWTTQSGFSTTSQPTLVQVSNNY